MVKFKTNVYLAVNKKWCILCQLMVSAVKEAVMEEPSQKAIFKGGAEGSMQQVIQRKLPAVFEATVSPKAPIGELEVLRSAKEPSSHC